ncbi:MAG TPA: tryptophan--tRNA ligase, partial [Nannocystis exedens]|nr:tryptophan--tRNA ligase [Nannocystis exedens]
MSGKPPTRVLSGVQPTGILHLGNYFGAIEQHIALQHEFPGQAYYFIADYHALTTVHDGQALREYTRQVAITYLALGLDPTRALLFCQSDVPEVLELAWMLATVTGMGLLQRAHSYKDKIQNGITPSAGLFFYPALMGADILIYNSNLVPVGKDQLQHIEFAQDMATAFNHAYGGNKGKNKGKNKEKEEKEEKEPVLRRPEPRLSKSPYVPGTDGRKMSKSYGNTIPLFLSGKKLRKLIGKIVTDSAELGQPLTIEHNTVYSLLQLFCDEAEMQTIAGWFKAGARDGQAFGYGHAKQLLANKIDTHFAAAR